MLEELFGLSLYDETLALCMVATLFIALLFGYPVAITLGGVGVLFAYLGPDPEILRLLPQRIWGVMGNATLLAVPLFISMGMLLEKSGLAQRLLTSLSALFGARKYGLALSVVLAGAVLAASTGIVGASVVTMGLISLPLMLRYGYTPSFAGGIICSSGTLGQIIPPSIVLILLGDIVGIPVGELFIAATLPGLLLVFLYCAYAMCYCSFLPRDSLSTAAEFQRPNLGELTAALVPPCVLIIAVLGSIFAGIASPTEAAAIGALGAFILCVLYRKCSVRLLTSVAQETAHLTSMVFFILLGAQVFGLVFRSLSGDEAIAELVLSTITSPTGFLAAIMLLLFILGCFLDFIEIVFIVVPILVPLVALYELDMTWVAILIALNLQTSFITPPFGFSLFYLKGVAGDSVTTTALYRGIIPFVALQALVVLLVWLFPEIATWLPAALS